MARINIYTTDDDGDRDLAGWFDPGLAEEFSEGRRWDGQNMVSVHVGQYCHQVLYRTKGGRWVLHDWSQWAGSEPRYEFVDDDAAKKWLLISGIHDAAVERYWPDELVEERGPGRPAVGPAINVRLTADQIAALDTRAAAAGVSRADLIRQYVTAGLLAAG